MNLDEKIKFIREQEKLSQDEFAKRLEVSRQTIINWEKGKSNPSFELLMVIANVFQFDINSLVQNEMEPVKLENKPGYIEESQNPPSFDLSLPPLYICKKSNIGTSISEFFIFILIGAVSCYLCYIFWLLGSSNWRWLILVELIIFCFWDLYNLIEIINNIRINKRFIGYFYKDYFFFQKGLKEKERMASYFNYYRKISIEQSFFGKIFNYGTVFLSFNSTNMTIHFCKKPYALKKFMQETYICKEDFTIK